MKTAHIQVKLKLVLTTSQFEKQKFCALTDINVLPTLKNKTKEREENLLNRVSFNAFQARVPFRTHKAHMWL